MPEQAAHNKTEHAEKASTHADAGQHSLVNPLALPAGFNGSCITRDPKGGRGPSVYPIKVIGGFVASGALAAGNNINLCYIPQNSVLTDFVIASGGITGTLQDNLATPTVYCTVGATLATVANMTGNQSLNLGTMYASTPRSAGQTGPAVVQWQRGMLLQLIVTGTPTQSQAMIYKLEFSPVYDA